MPAVHGGFPARTALALVLSLGAVAAAAAAEFRGFVTEGPAGLLVFQPCRGGSPTKSLLRITDRSPETALTAGVSAVRQVMEDAERPLYVEFSGEAAGSHLTVRRFHRAIGHVPACAGAPWDLGADVTLQASGRNPAWRLVVGGGGARLELDSARPVRFPAAAFAVRADSGPTRTHDAWSAQDGGTVRVEITEALCLDEQGEAAFGARVALRYGTTAVEGCAARF